MNYSLLITAPANDLLTHRRAMAFAEALFEAKHSIRMIFFYGASTSVGLASRVKAQNPRIGRIDWNAFAEKINTRLTLCISSALNEGVFDKTEASRMKTKSTIASGFEIAGMGSFIEAIDESDRLMTFGG